jgi:hypothetical protein
VAATILHAWPDELPAQFALVRRLLTGSTQSTADAATLISDKLAGRNTPKRRAQVQAILDTLQSLGGFTGAHPCN